VEVERGKVEEGIGEDGREDERGTYDGEGAWIGRRTAVVDMVAMWDWVPSQRPKTDVVWSRRADRLGDWIGGDRRWDAGRW
jgi:hypothetical protein